MANGAPLGYWNAAAAGLVLQQQSSTDEHASVPSTLLQIGSSSHAHSNGNGSSHVTLLPQHVSLQQESATELAAQMPASTPQQVLSKGGIIGSTQAAMQQAGIGSGKGGGPQQQVA